MRPTSIALVAAVMAAGFCGACGAPPPPVEGLCDQDPVDLGEATRVRGVSADGGVAIVWVAGPDEVPVAVLVDLDTGERKEVERTSPQGDGVETWIAEDGTSLLGRRYDPGESTYFRYDVATGAQNPVVHDIGYLLAVSGDAASVVEGTADGWAVVDVDTGERTPLGLVATAGWQIGAFSPDLSLAVQQTSGSATVRNVRVLDAATGQVVLDIGAVRSEGSSYMSVRFVDDRTLLFDDAVPAPAIADSVPDDGAFLVDVPSGLVTRLDSGIVASHVQTATPDGRRSLVTRWSPSASWLRIDGANTELVDEWSGWEADRALTRLVRVDDGRAWLRCV